MLGMSYEIGHSIDLTYLNKQVTAPVAAPSAFERQFIVEPGTYVDLRTKAVVRRIEVTFA